MGAIKTDSKVRDIQELIRSKGIDAFFINNIKNVRYLTGFTGSSGFVLITGDKNLFFTDFRYKIQAESEVKGYEIGIEKGIRINVISSLIRRLGIKRFGFETSMAYGFYELLKGLSITLIPLRGVVEECRESKGEEEISSIKEAVRRAERAFLKVKTNIKVGIKERDIGLRLEDQLRKEGCRRIPFDIIVASGKNSSMPHARPTEKKIEEGDFVIIDWGGEANEYCSDMTRTFFMGGEISSEKIAMYNAVNGAREKAIESVREGMGTQKIDSVARTEIEKAGYGRFFGHSTGHGVGLDIKEYPFISQTDDRRISNGMVFTIEPGVYIPSLGGVRIEDMVVVKEEKAILLTSLSRELEII
ncbi:aminopeptidase P family protein [Thermodesulfovibrionales bacterium]|nr:aminopeptidase P family protein [Thermodesulfovibrionales bacterium]